VKVQKFTEENDVMKTIYATKEKTVDLRYRVGVLETGKEAFCGEMQILQE
jgi:hypothetical protein